MIAVLEPMEFVFPTVTVLEVRPLDLGSEGRHGKDGRAARSDGKAITCREAYSCGTRRQAAGMVGWHGNPRTVQRNYPGHLSQVKPI
jgi:hypothetical protein